MKPLLIYCDICGRRLNWTHAPKFPVAYGPLQISMEPQGPLDAGFELSYREVCINCKNMCFAKLQNSCDERPDEFRR